MHTVLVTGATGFLGQHLVRRLVQDDPDVKVKAFSRSPWSGFDSTRVQGVPGDITRRGDVEAALEGVDEVYHLAGVVDRTPTEPWLLYRIHVGGTRNLCEAMRHAKVRRCVLVSTSGTVAVSKDAVEHTEESSYKQEVVGEWPYYLSKIYQEKQALWYCTHRDLPIVVVNPSLVLGPGDVRLSSTNDVRLFLKGQIKVLPPGGVNMVDVRDAAAGLVAAMREGRPGERYLLGGENFTFREWIVQTAELASMPRPTIRLPEPLARLGAATLRRLYPLVGKRFELDDASVRMSSLFWYCNSAKARRELGFTTRPADKTLRDTISYLRASGAA